MDGKSLDIAQEKISRLRGIFPEAVTDGKLDWDRLRQALGESLAVGQERYGLSWPGKSEVFRTIQEPTTATLVPAREQSIDFDATENVFIEGENLETLKVLQKAYFGKVKVIIIDEPYNTGNDTFVYPDNFAERKDAYLKRINEVDDQGYLNKEDLFRKNARESGHFHSNWLGMMYPRLYLARNLLREDGVIFVCIDDNEVHNLRLMMNEVFGEENFIDTLIWKKRYGGGSKEKYLVSIHEYILFFAKNKECLQPLFVPNDPEMIAKYYKLQDEKYEKRGPYRTHPLEATKSMGERKNLIFPIPAPDGTEIWPKRQWLWSRERVQNALNNNELELIKIKGGWSVNTKQYLRDDEGNIRNSKAFSIIDNVFTQHGTNEIIEIFSDAQIFPFPKPTGLIKPLLQIAATGDDDLVLDFFGGACSTAHAVLYLNRQDGGNRRFIMIQLPEKTDENGVAFKAGYRTIADIGKERIRRVIAKMKKDREEKLPLTEKPDLGFKVFKLRPSNFRVWRCDIRTPEQLATQLEMSLDNVKPHAERENQLWEILLKAGYPLSAKVEEKDLGGHPVHVVEEGKLAIALSGVSVEVIAAVVRMKPLAFICPDSLFGGNDPLKTNAALQLRDAGIDFKSL